MFVLLLRYGKNISVCLLGREKSGKEWFGVWEKVKGRKEGKYI